MRWRIFKLKSPSISPPVVSTKLGQSDTTSRRICNQNAQEALRGGLVALRGREAQKVWPIVSDITRQ